jgi:hypothetical protein
MGLLDPVEDLVHPGLSSPERFYEPDGNPAEREVENEVAQCGDP